MRNCKKCSRRAQVRLSVEDAATNQIISQYKRGASVRQITWNLKREDVVSLLKAKCFWCGEPPSNTFVLKRTFDYSTFVYNGIDRLDNRVGYTSINCVASCGTCNWMKKDLSKEEFVAHARKITLQHPERQSQN
jgi:hypothetical protein